MSFSLDAPLEDYCACAATEREKGTYYEPLRAAFLTRNLVQAEAYEQIWIRADGAAANG